MGNVSFPPIADILVASGIVCDADGMPALLTHAVLASLVVFAVPTAAQTPDKSGSPREINITSDSAPGWLPTESLERDVKGTVDRYFNAIDSGRYREAYAMMNDANKAALPYEQFEQQSSQFHAQAGPLKQRQVLKITWTKDPANAPYRGVYAAIDEAATYQNADRQCGYIIIYQRPTGGDLEVMRAENNFIDNASAAKIARTQSPAELDRIWAALSANCPNFARGTSPRAQTENEPLPEASGSTIGYPSVAAALEALHVRPNVVFTTKDGWVIATDEAAYTVWSFAPPNYPAYPAVVKRQVISEPTGSSIQTSVQCEASKSACDDLVRTFSQMNEAARPK